MMNATGPETALRDFEAAALAEQDIARRHPHILEHDFRVAVRRIVIAEYAEVTQHAHAGRIERHQDHRLPLVRLCVGIGQAHDDGDLAARVHGAGGPPFAAVDDVVIAVAADFGADVGGVGRGDVGLGHGKAGAYGPLHQRLQPALLLFGGPVADDGFHVAGVRRRAIEGLRADRRTSHDLAQRRVVQIAEPVGVFVFRQKQVPQTVSLGLGLERVDHGWNGPAAWAAVELLRINRLGRVNVGIHEFGDAAANVLRAIGHRKQHHGPSG